MIVLLGGCAVTEEMKEQLATLDGRHIDSVVRILGTPDDSVNLGTKRIYVWTSSFDFNLGSTSYGTSSSGESVEVYDPNGGQEISFTCRIEAHTNDEFIVMYSTIEGTRDRCKALLGDLAP